MLSLCYRKDFFVYSVQAKQIKIGQNRRRGRPRLTAPALHFQEKEYIFSDTASEGEEAVENNKKKRKQENKRKAAAEDSDYDIFADEDPIVSSQPTSSILFKSALKRAPKRRKVDKSLKLIASKTTR